MGKSTRLCSIFLISNSGRHLDHPLFVSAIEKDVGISLRCAQIGPRHLA